MPKHPIADIDLPDHIPARSYDRDTAKQAAAEVNITEREHECMTIYWMVKHGQMVCPGYSGATDLTNDELSILTGDAQVANISSRSSKLYEKGVLRYTGNKRQSREGRDQDCKEYVEKENWLKQAAINQAEIAARKAKPWTCPTCGELHVCKKPSASVTMQDMEEL